jgi:hypothetical protein
MGIRGLEYLLEQVGFYQQVQEMGAIRDGLIDSPSVCGQAPHCMTYRRIAARFRWKAVVYSSSVTGVSASSRAWRLAR